jgi:hypothetical protein
MSGPGFPTEVPLVENNNDYINHLLTSTNKKRVKHVALPSDFRAFDSRPCPSHIQS